MLGFVIGCAVGGTVGIVTMCFCNAAGRSEQE